MAQDKKNKNKKTIENKSGGNSVQKQEDTNFSRINDRSDDKNYASSKEEVDDVLKEFLFKPRDKKIKPVSTNVMLTPDVKEEFQKFAKSHGMSLAELMRRVIFAAISVPDIITRSDVDERESVYRSSIGASRWTRDR